MLRTTVIENGALRGLPAADPRITVYKGVPFAAPPVGENRWRAPLPCGSWEGVYDAFQFAPIPMQDTPGLGEDLYCREWHVDPKIPMSEDCLYLNVWTPAAAGGEKLPVLLWYYGGGFQWGYSAEMEFDGERLARRGIVVVTAAYRLGVFGYLAHPELTAEAPEAPSNFGLLDQQAALRWVYRNVEAFGGDPEKITIAGQSAGGSSVLNLLACPGNRPLIRGAAVFSGFIRHPDPEEDIFAPLSLEYAEQRGEAFFNDLGVSSLWEARQIDSVSLRDAYSRYAEDHPRMFPNLDGQYVKGDPLELLMSGEAAQVPILSGNTADEFLWKGESIIEQSVKQAFLAADEAGSAQSHYYYRFDADIPGYDHPGTFHSVDLWFFFETLAKCSRPFEGRHYDLARQMCDYFANFVKWQDPNGRPSCGTGSSAGEAGDCGQVRSGSGILSSFAKASQGERFRNGIGECPEERPLPLWLPYTADQRAEMEFLPNGAALKYEGGIRQGISGKKQAVNPYLPSWEYIPDGEPYVFGDRVYIYGSHDRFGGETFCLRDYVCWSAPVDNLGDWHYEGVIFRKTDDPMNEDGEMCLYAPDVTVGPDGRFYLYYVLDHADVVSVAVSDVPQGPFSFLGYVHYPDGTKLGHGRLDEPQFDPGVLTEGDVTYLYTGFCPKGDYSRSGARVARLAADMLTVVNTPHTVVPGCCCSEGTPFAGHAFFEASSIRRIGDRYCFIYSSEVMHELCYAFSDSPEGPFVYGGVLVSNCDIGIERDKPASLSMAYGANNHGSMVQIGSDWYIFYHRHTNSSWYSRQGCAEKLEIAGDGSIRQAEMTSCGLNGGPLCDKGEYPAYLACNLFTGEHTVYVEKTAPCITQEGGDAGRGCAYLSHFGNGAAAGFKYFLMEGVNGVRVRTRGYFRGVMEVRLSWDGEVIGKIPIDHSNTWKDRACHFPEVSGVHALFLTMRGEGETNLLSFELLHG